MQAIAAPTAEEGTSSCDMLPLPLRDADRSAMFQFLVRLAKVIAPDAENADLEEPHIRLAGIHAACVTLQSWPSGLDGVDLPASTSTAMRASLNASWNSLANVTKPNSEADQLSRSLTADTAPKTSGEGPVGIRRATEIARISPHVLLSAWEHGLVTKHQRRHGRRLMLAFDRVELARLSKDWLERRGIDSVAEETGLPWYAVGQMVQYGCLSADAPAIPGTGPHFTPSEMTNFHQAIRNGCTAIANPNPLKHVLRLVAEQLEPWGIVFRLLLDGSLPFDLQGGRRLADSIVVHQRDIQRITALVFGMPSAPARHSNALMPQHDALEVLNASPVQPHLLRGLSCKGNNPRLYLVSQVLERAAEIVTIPEIAARLNTDPATAWQELRRRNLLEAALDQGAWPRSILAELC